MEGFHLGLRQGLVVDADVINLAAEMLTGNHLADGQRVGVGDRRILGVRDVDAVDHRGVLKQNHLAISLIDDHQVMPITVCQG
jgi:hypothetical protein